MKETIKHQNPPKLLGAVAWQVAESLVRLVPQYQHIASIELGCIQTNRIESLSQFVRTCRLQFAEAVITQMQAVGINLFKPVSIYYEDKKRVVMPPVVEKHGGRYILMDGTHRIWLARKYSIGSVYVICVSNINLTLPSDCVLWDKVTEREDYYTTEENLVNFDRSLFRPVTTTFNGPQTLI